VDLLGDAITPAELKQHVDSLVAVYVPNWKHTNVHESFCAVEFIKITVPIPIPTEFVAEAKTHPGAKGLLRAMFHMEPQTRLLPDPTDPWWQGFHCKVSEGYQYYTEEVGFEDEETIFHEEHFPCLEAEMLPVQYDDWDGVSELVLR
jgi:hypothetical protein